MCAICCVVCSCGLGDGHISSELRIALGRRGPDTSLTFREVECADRKIVFAGCVLQMRDSLCHQPCTSSTDSNNIMFCWNGELYSDREIGVSDTTHVFNEIIVRRDDNIDEFVNQMQAMNGEWTFVSFNASFDEVLLGKDRVGQKSLLMSKSNECIILSSLVDTDSSISNWIEVTPGIHCLNLMNLSITSHMFENSPQSPSKGISIPQLDFINELQKSSHCVNVETIFDVSDKIFNSFLDKVYNSLTQSILNRTFYSSQNITELSVLFSGGLDSTILAKIIDTHKPPGVILNLLNVCFSCANNLTVSPDRISGVKSFQELCDSSKSPANLRFIAINVTKQELEELRKSRIKSLIWPNTAVLDDGLGCALWFASRGHGKARCSEHVKNAHSDIGTNKCDKHSWCNSEVKVASRIVISGLGADELFGGYSRHRGAFFQSKSEDSVLIQPTDSQAWKRVDDEMTLELDRLYSRNCGRDDRIVSDHGKELRFPFLDHHFISCVTSIPLPYRTAPYIKDRGIGDKFLLRCLAYTKLGLKFSSISAKRAMQFGSRIAKLEGGSKERADDLCSRLQQYGT